MSINLNILRETFESSQEDMLKNKSLTNELLVDDLMLELGYNKKRDKSVKRFYKGNIDWLVNSDENQEILAVKTFPVGEAIYYAEVQGLLNLLTDRKILVILVTNGITITIYCYNHLDNNYKYLTNIDIFKELTDDQNFILDTISKDKLNNNVIRELIETNYISEEKVISILKTNIDSIINIISNKEKISDKDKIRQIILKVLDNDIDTNIVENDNEVEILNNEINNLKSVKSELENELRKLKENKEVSNEELNDEQLKHISGLTLQNKSLISEIEELHKEIDIKKQEIIDKENDNKELANKVDRLKEKINLFTDTNIDKYIEQITNLTEEKTILEEENRSYIDKIKELNDALNNLDNSGRKKSLELLDLIESDENKPKQYVSVVNTKLFVSETLSRFIGQTIQELSQLKGSEAAPFIFDGDLFELEKHNNMNTNVSRRDLHIGDSMYQINTDGMSDKEVVNKLRILFSNFDDVVFEYKIIGNIEIDKDINEEIEAETDLENSDSLVDDNDTKNYYNNESENKEEHTEEVNETIYNTDDSYNNEYTQEQNNDDFNNTNKEIEKIVNNIGVSLKKETKDNSIKDEELKNVYGDSIVKPSKKVEEKLLAIQLMNKDILYNQDIEFNNIKYIGTNEHTYSIIDDKNLDKVVCKCIDSIIAIEASRDNTEIIKKLKQTDLSIISEYIHRINESNINYPKITASRYCVNGFNNIREIIKTLYNICEKLSIEMNDIFIYLTTTSNYSEIDKYIFDENSIYIQSDLSNFVNYTSNNETKFAIIKGDLLNNTVITEQSLVIHKKLIKQSIGLKSKIISQQIKDYDSIINIIEAMILDAMNLGIELETICKCTTLDGKYKVVSIEQDNTRVGSKQLYVNSICFYVSRLDDWEIAETIIRLHTTIYNTTSIAVKAVVDTDILNYLYTMFNTSEPSLALAVYSLRNYINNYIR